MYFLRNVDPETSARALDSVIQIQTRGDKASYLAVTSSQNEHSNYFLLPILQRTIKISTISRQVTKVIIFSILNRK